MKPIHAALIIALVVATGAQTSRAQKRTSLQPTSNLKASDFVSTGRNRYFILEPGYRLVLTGTKDGRKANLVITVLDETTKIGEVETRVVEERESVADSLVELSQNYYAMVRKTHDIYCFGENVDRYRHGRLEGHPGSWRAGGRNQFGLAMPATPQFGQSYWEELAPGVALDRAKIVSIDASLSTPAGNFDNVLRVEETSSLEPGVKEYKYYAPGIGLIRDGDMVLAKRPTVVKGAK